MASKSGPTSSSLRQASAASYGCWRCSPYVLPSSRKISFSSSPSSSDAARSTSWCSAVDELVRLGLAPADVRDRAEGREVRVVDVEDAVPVVERVVVAPQLVAGDPGPAREGVRRGPRRSRDVVLALEDVHELRPCWLRLVEVREGVRAPRGLRRGDRARASTSRSRARADRAGRRRGGRSWRGSRPRPSRPTRSRARARRRR